MNIDAKGLEPAAAFVPDDEGFAPALASIAASLKRIADMLSETNEYGEGPAAAIGGAISRGMRNY